MSDLTDRIAKAIQHGIPNEVPPLVLTVGDLEGDLTAARERIAVLEKALKEIASGFHSRDSMIHMARVAIASAAQPGEGKHE